VAGGELELLGGGVLLGGVLLGVELGVDVSLGVVDGVEPEDDAGVVLVGVLAGVGLPVDDELGVVDGVVLPDPLDVLVPEGLAEEAELEGLALEAAELAEADRLGDADVVGLLLSAASLDTVSADASPSTALVVAVGRVVHGFVELSRTSCAAPVAALPTPVVAAARTRSMPTLAI